MKIKNKLMSLFHKIENKWVHLKTLCKCRALGFPQDILIGRNVRFRGVEYMHIGSGACFNNDSIIEAWDKFRTERYNPILSIGANCSFGEYSHITCCNQISIGKNVLTGRFVLITDNSHGTFGNINIPPRERPLVSKGPVFIGDNVWIGDKVSILSGVSIGDNAIIATGAIVTKDIPANCLVAGCPAKIIKQK